MSLLTALKLSPRDKRILIIGGIIIFTLTILFTVVLPNLEEIHRLDRAIAKEQKTLSEVRRSYEAFQEMGERQSLVQEKLRQRASETFSIQSVIQGMARESKLMEQLQYIKPDQGEMSGEFREASVSLKASQITLDVLVDFLHRIESSDMVLRIRSLQIRSLPNAPGRVDVTLTVSTLLPTGGAT